MRLEKLGENSVFVFLPEFEPVWAALSLLTGEKIHRLCTEIYGAETIALLRRRYNFLFESFQAVEKTNALNLPDFLLDLPLENVSLEGYRDYLLRLPPEEFLWRYLDLDFCPEADMDTLRRALTEDSALDAVYGWRQEGQLLSRALPLTRSIEAMNLLFSGGGARFPALLLGELRLSAVYVLLSLAVFRGMERVCRRSGKLDLF